MAHAYTAPELEHIARTLGGARKCKGGWECRCPVHDDRKASLSLNIGDNGRLLWNCHAGCDQHTVLEGLRARGVLVNGDARKAEPDPGRIPRPRIVKAYDYLDENSAMLFQVVRFDPKDFRQRRSNGKGDWIWDLDGVRRVLYRLPEILVAEEAVVVEGEKDADRLHSLGFVATTSPQGAGKWRPEYAQTLADKQVTIIPDSDGPGRQHARAVAASLLGKAASVRLLDLKGAKDASAWLDAGHTADELRELIAKADPVEAWKLRLDDGIDELNERYFVVMLSGKGVIASVERDGLFDRERMVFSRPQDVRLLYANRHYQVRASQKGGEIWKGLGDAWVEHPRRCTYERLTLSRRGRSRPAPTTCGADGASSRRPLTGPSSASTCSRSSAAATRTTAAT
jgi:5S rRNA maturation endonuclease (ribonuclease M5)